MINDNDKPEPKFGMAMGASRGMRGGTVGEAVNRGYREGIPSKPRTDGDKKPSPKGGANKIKPEAYKAYILAKGKR